MANLKLIEESVVEGNVEQVKELTEKAIADGMDVATILDDGLIAGMGAIGEQYERKEAYVPELLLSARAMRAGMELLEPLLVSSGVEPKGKVALGTVKGDIHNIGKDLVGIKLKGAGFEITDLGVDVPPEKFVEVVRKGETGIVGMSGLLTTTLPLMKTTIEALDAAGFKGQVKIMIGGALVTQDYADRIGADGYAANAPEAVSKAKELLGLERNRK
ncbi:MAG: corrinoid protein [Dehalococcoidia bacterium]|nr:corrinoid protein [Dehalococcoidia bacterium]